MKNKVTTHQIKEEKFENFISVPYQTEEKLENLSDFQQIQGKFYQLFATDLRWSLEKFEKKLPQLSFVWREGGRKEESYKK